MFGFSKTGALICLVVLVPSVSYVVLPPVDGPSGLSHPRVVFEILEKVGQAGCVAC